MKKFLTLYKTEQILGFRSPDGLIFGVAMPVGILILIAVVAGDKAAGAGAGYTFLQSSFAALCGVGICACAFMGIPLSVADYRDKKILKHFFVTPCSPMLLLGALLACGVVTSALSVTAISLVACLFLGYRMVGNVLAFAGAYILVLTAMFSIGMVLAALCKTVKIANVVTSIVYFPMLFLSGATIPFELFPKGVQAVASVLPLTQGIKLMKQISMGEKTENVAGIIFLMAGITVVSVIVTKLTFKWE